jgi:AraC-like DNA-binding protein
MMVMMPLRGVAEVQYQGQRIRSTPLQPVVISPTQALSMRWQDDCDQLIVRIARDAIEGACATQLGHELHAPLTFDLAMNPDAESMSAWRRLLACLVCDEVFVRSALDYPMVGAQAEQLLISALLVGQVHNYRSELDKPERHLTPAYVRRAEEYMHAHVHEEINMDMVTRCVGVSARSLFTGFQRYRGTSPMAYLRDLRLDKVRADLLNARKQGLRQNVTDTALRWGFGHLSHFTRAYEARFRELPSQTLYGPRYRNDAIDAAHAEAQAHAGKLKAS